MDNKHGAGAKAPAPWQIFKEPQPVGEGHDPPAEKRSFSDFPKENNLVFALRRQILLWQNLRATTGRPYSCFGKRRAVAFLQQPFPL